MAQRRPGLGIKECCPYILSERCRLHPAQEIKICGINQEQTWIWASTRYHTPSHHLQVREAKSLYHYYLEGKVSKADFWLNARFFFLHLNGKTDKYVHLLSFSWSLSLLGSQRECWSLSQLHMGNGRLNPWMTLDEYLGVWYLAQKYIGGCLRVSPAAMVWPHWGFNQQPSTSQPSSCRLLL